MPEAIRPEQLESLARLQDTVRAELELQDEHLSRLAWRTSFLQMLLIGSLGTIAILGSYVMLKDRDVTVGAVVSVLAGASTAILSYLIGFRSPLKMTRYLASRDELRKHLLDVDVYFHGKTLDPEKFQQFYADIQRLLEKQQEALGPELVQK